MCDTTLKVRCWQLYPCWKTQGSWLENSTQFCLFTCRPKHLTRCNKRTLKWTSAELTSYFLLSISITLEHFKLEIQYISYTQSSIKNLNLFNTKRNKCHIEILLRHATAVIILLFFKFMPRFFWDMRTPRECCSTAIKTFENSLRGISPTTVLERRETRENYQTERRANKWSRDLSCLWEEKRHLTMKAFLRIVTQQC